jgi:hypothetical protein
MAKLEKTRLFDVRCGAKGNIIYSGIEAETAEEAIRKSSRSEGQIVSQVDSVPIYTAGLDCETNEENKTENSVFEITVRGTDEESVETLRHAIALAIGGMAVDFAELNKDGDSDGGRALQRFIDKTCLSIVAM